MWEFVNLSSFIMQLINMGIIIYILNRFLFKPYLKFIKEEDKKRVELDTAYEEMNVLKEEAKMQAGQIIESAKANALEIRANMETLANQEKEAIIAKAEAEWKDIVEYATKKAEDTKNSMLKDVKTNIIDLVLKLNGKIFGKEEANKAFLENELQALTK